MASTKSPKKKLKIVMPYIILIGIVLLIFGIGFLIGRLCVPTQAKDDTTQIISSTVSTTEETIVETEPPIKWLEFRATAYCPCEKCCGKWATLRPQDENGQPIVYGATGIVLQSGISVAADTSIYPMGTVLEIQGFGKFIVQDRGGSIKGNRIDIYFDNHDEAVDFGVQTVKVRVIK